jgi:hypothetical protein
MTAKLDYRWHLRQVMAARGMFATTDLLLAAAMFAHELAALDVHVVAGLGGDVVLGGCQGLARTVSRGPSRTA